MSQVAALYIDPKGPYPKLLGAGMCWPAYRDAKLYEGPWPVVAHPPCGPWGRMSQFCKQDSACGPRAVEQVRRWGGVLEHPKGSRLWQHCGLPIPGDGVDAWGGGSFEVHQVAWGHSCDKPTWLYVVGVPREEVARLIVETRDLTKKPTHKVRNRTAGNLLQASREARSRTPPAFADLLLDLARRARTSVRTAV